MPHYAVGIDLGTTNCALAWIDLRAKAPTAKSAQVLNVPQLVDVGQIEAQPLLPSFAYLAGSGEFPEGSCRLAWQTSDVPIVGAAARKLGNKVPGRLVASAKSWLCHGGVDRKAKILPWQTQVEVERVSPVEASALYLAHLRDAWNADLGKKSEADRLEAQTVVLTIPASFDEVARELTVEAAQKAGLPHITLLEEPQAAFYQWLQASAKAAPLGVGAVALVIDCGGGTTDFSLLAVREESGQATYERIAVGDHLLLGGDNIDIAIARHVEESLGGRRLDLGQWWSLVLDARRAKEAMLANDAPEKLPIAVLGRGRKIIGEAMKAEISREDVQRIALDGFFPMVGFDDMPSRQARVGLQEFGLPFVADPAVTKHLAEFLARHRETICEASPTADCRPTAVLFNGGVFNAEACRQRILDVMQSWYDKEWTPTVLETSSLDLAVAQGAAQYGYLRATGGARIKSGAARSYYVGIQTESKSAEGKQTVLCIVPQGLDEGEQIHFEEPPLDLQLGEPVAFPLFTSTVRPRDTAGKVFAAKPGQLAELPALTTILRGGKRAGNKRIAVRLESMLTEIGTLELYCAARDGNNRWKLQFQTRSSPRLDVEEETAPTGSQSLVETWSEEQLSAGREVLTTTFSRASGKVDPQQAVQLPKRLETALGLSRSAWPTSMLRALWESLLGLSEGRKFTPEHEGRWLNFAGYFLRPGWGDPLDPFRVELLWKVIHAGVVHAKADPVWAEYWILCRRIAGGLDATRQLELSKRLLSYLPLSGNRKPPRRIGSHEEAEIWRATASMEHLGVAVKVELGERLLEIARKSQIPGYVFWSLARLGSRVPLYGPANVVVNVDEAEKWIATLLDFELSESGIRVERDFALAQIARMSGDRARDIDEALRQRVLDHLDRGPAPAHYKEIVATVHRLSLSEETKLLGDALPAGLRVRAT